MPLLRIRIIGKSNGVNNFWIGADDLKNYPNHRIFEKGLRYVAQFFYRKYDEVSDQGFVASCSKAE